MKTLLEIFAKEIETEPNILAMKTDPYRSYSECTACGRTDASANMYRSILIGGIYCEHCKDRIIADDEEENPGSPENHKEKDFEPAPVN